MAKRKRVGIIYQYNENWIGGTYYIENLIAALNYVADEKKPALVVFTDDENSAEKLFDKVTYPYISYRPYSRKLHLIERVINFANRAVFEKNIFLPVYNDLDLVFPATNEDKFSKGQKFLYWIPDFQEHFLPDFFNDEEFKWRKDWQQFILNNARYILFSSNSVKKDFNHIYPGTHLSQFVVKFAVTHPMLGKEINLSDFQIPENFFICSNQFWKHKNHIVVLKAIQLLKQSGDKVFVVFTGKEHDYRHPDYFNQLKETADALSITDYIKFLGFVKRNIQLELMKKAIAVIQPSLFEGWSTVVEDAKSLGTDIVASDLEVHKEQLSQYPGKTFFDPQDEYQLSKILKQKIETEIIPFEYDYFSDIKAFGESFHKTLEEVVA